MNLRHYIPDVLVLYNDTSHVLIEVKPQCFLDAEINIAKFNAAKKYCDNNGYEFKVITQKEIM